MNDQHVSFQAHGVPVMFPFEPYDQQRDYCSQVILAIKTQENAILESPTGTGKTLSLLTSSLAWQQSASTDQGKMIYYLSRTHLQLSQAAKEMKKTAYARIPSVVLASRTHMCLNSEVKDQSPDADVSINRACQNAIARNSCSYFTNYEDKLKAHLDFNQVHDIEDLHNFGRRNQCCPFYASKKIAETQASLVFMPYNYVLDLSVRKSINLKLDKSVLIIDEGHNIESSLKDSASANFTMAFLKTIQESCEKIPKKLNEAIMRDNHGITRYGYDPERKQRKNGSAVVNEVRTKGAIEKKTPSEKESKPNQIEELAALLTNDKIQQVNRCVQSLSSVQDLLKTDRGRYIETKCDIDSLISILKKAGVKFDTADTIMTTLDSMCTFWSIVGVVNPQIIARYMVATTSLCHFISLIFPPGAMSLPKMDLHLSNLKKNYAAYMLVETEKDTILQSSSKLTNWELHLWCLNPGIGMRRVIDDSCVDGPRSIIITSGTLAPMSPIKRELQRDFKIIKEFDHLISKNQMKITILNQSPSGFSLDTTYSSTQNPKCLLAIGETISSLLCALPFGTLIFFPSYRVMRLVLTHCESKPFWNSLRKSTNIFVESRDQFSFVDDMMRYKKAVDSNGRAVFMGVCRGKLSEGTNLNSDYCRSVIIVGLPFPSRGDAKIKETLSFQTLKGDTNGKEWYSNQMRRALGQAIGRIIRSRKDFGMVFLCDPRFTMYKFSISKWIQEFYPKFSTSDYKQVANDIRDFYSNHGIDISEMSLTNAVYPSQVSSAFEFDQCLTKRIPNSDQQQAVSAMCDISFVQKVNSKTAINRTFKERQVELLAAYTVDQETRDRIAKQQKAKGVSTSKARTPPTTFQIFHTVCPSFPSTQIRESTSSNLPGSDIARTQECQKETSPGLAAQQSKQSTPPRKKRKVKTPMTQPITKEDKPKCYICLNDATTPCTTNCQCQRVGCKTCLKGLNNKVCGDCGTVLKLRHFKQRMFNLFQKR